MKEKAKKYLRFLIGLSILISLLSIPMTSFASELVEYIATYMAEDGSILTITSYSVEDTSANTKENEKIYKGYYRVNLDGNIYEGLNTVSIIRGYYERVSTDGEIKFSTEEFATFNEDGTSQTLVLLEDTLLFKNINEEDTNYYLVRFDEEIKNYVHTTDSYEIIKTYKLIDSKANALSTASKVLVNGEEINFEAYYIDGNNFFKLRDIAKVLSGSKSQFEVTWDGENNAINLISGKEYTPVGGELTGIASQTTTPAVLSKSTVYKDGEPVSLLAYNINGNNYFKLRDIGKAFDFEVTWEAKTNTILINTEN